MRHGGAEQRMLKFWQLLCPVVLNASTLVTTEWAYLRQVKLQFCNSHPCPHDKRHYQCQNTSWLNNDVTLKAASHLATFCCALFSFTRPPPVEHRIKKGATLGATFFIKLVLCLYLNLLYVINGTRSRYHASQRRLQKCSRLFALESHLLAGSGSTGSTPKTALH